MDWGKINFNVESKGSQVRTFGTMRAPGQYKTLINEIPDHKPGPYELPLIFPEKVELWEIKGTGFEKVSIDALKVEVERAKKANEHTFTDIDFSGIDILKFPCIRMLFESGLRKGRYYAGESVFLMCEKCRVTKEETLAHLRKLFATFPGITPSETDLRINNVLTMYGTGYKFSCRTVKETFGKEFCNFSNCPVKVKIDEIKIEMTKQDYETIAQSISKLPKSDNTTENVKVVKKFIVDHLKSLPLDVVYSLIDHEITDNFKPYFTREDGRNMKRYYRRVKGDDEDTIGEKMWVPPFEDVASKIMERLPIFTFD